MARALCKKREPENENFRGSVRSTTVGDQLLKRTGVTEMNCISKI